MAKAFQASKLQELKMDDLYHHFHPQQYHYPQTPTMHQPTTNYHPTNKNIVICHQKITTTFIPTQTFHAQSTTTTFQAQFPTISTSFHAP